ncbi:MAG: response regulator [Saccharofermentanales bacterium]|jgi:DNA-binding NarL/FixJ family response regulator|nr:response regulator transcription factor [Bacillota bacterium]NLB08252.1 response regulator transcription factor [Clostridiales bacterium]
MRILVVDDDTLVLKSLQMILNTEGVDEVYTSKNGKEAFDIYKDHTIDLVLQDIRLKDENGIDIASKLLEHDSDAKIILLTTFKDEEYINRAIKIGVKGYILKDNIDSLFQSIQTVMAGNMVLDSEVIQDIKLSNRVNKSIEDFDITERELEIIKLLAEGMNNKEISQSLYLSEGTVRNYISNLLDKLDLRDRSQLVVFYYKNLHNE